MPGRLLPHRACWLAAVLASASSFAVAAANPGGSGVEAARESVKRFTVANGLEVTLFASEPMVRNPTDMDVDARGRVWITEGVNYRSSFQSWGILQPAGDRVVILEDTNGDGMADKETTFYQGKDINTALGICVLGNRVIVSCSPNVFVLTDTNGDDHADTKEVLFTGIGGVDHDHGVHAFVFGPDGKLYFNMGNESKQLRRPDGSPVLDVDGREVASRGKPYRQGLAMRCNPDGSEVEVMAHNFRNNYELAVDSFGTLWQSDNDDDGNRGVRINYLMAHGNFGFSDEQTGAGWQEGWRKAAGKGAPESEKVFHEWHQYDPGVVPNLLNTGAGSPTGILVYEGDLLPEVFRNQIIHCDAGPRVVRAYPVENDGAGYKARMEDILTGSDTWFRPSDVCVGPDGSLYIADWNDAGVGGHNMADRNLATMSGRVYRVAPPGRKAVVPKLDLRTPAGAAAALRSPNAATRYLAWTALHGMGTKAEAELLKQWRGTEPRLRARALQLLARLKGNQYLEQAIADADPDIRITALRIAQSLKLDLIPGVRRLVSDPSARVRRECALSLRRSASPEAPALWAKLAAQLEPQDRWYLEALGIGAEGQWDAFLDAWLAQAGDPCSTPAGREILWRSRAKKTPAYLAKLIANPAVAPMDRARYFRSLDFIPGPERDAALMEILMHNNDAGSRPR